MTKIMAGESVGDTKYQANRTVRALEKSDMHRCDRILLKGHLLKCDIATKVAASNIAKLARDERECCFKELLQDDMDIPGVLQGPWWCKLPKSLIWLPPRT